MNTSEATGSRPQLTEQYYKAHRQYGLFAALLLAWELVGIRFVNDVPLAQLNVRLLSPEAAPWVVIVLLAYFGFRTSIEWHHSDPMVRERRASRADFYALHVVAFAAIAMFAYQRLRSVQIADARPDAAYSLLSGFAIGVGVVSVGELLRMRIRKDEFSPPAYRLALGLGFGAAGLTWLGRMLIAGGLDAMAFAAGLAVGVGFWVIPGC